MKKPVKKEYYYIYYNCDAKWWYPEEKGGGFSSECNKNCQALSDIHPLQWQLDCNEEYHKYIIDEQGYKHIEYYTVISWQRISKKVYNKFKGHIG